MVRYSLVLMVGLWTASAASASTWASALFDELSVDFGSVPRGPTLEHYFRVRNTTGGYVHIANVRVSCGCVSPVALKKDLAPGEETSIMIHMDTLRFVGPKTVTVFVEFDRPQWDTVNLLVQANGRDDFSVSPDTLAIGRAKRNTAPSAAVNISFLGSPQTRIIDAKPESNYVQTSVQEMHRQSGEVVYQLSARVRPEIPVGKWYTDIWVRTNNPSLPRIRVPLTVEIEAPLSVSPSVVDLGEVKVGNEAEHKIWVRGGQAFRIVDVKGIDGEVDVKEISADSKPVHVLTVKVKGEHAGELNRHLRVITDMKDEGEIEFQAKAQIVPENE